MKIAKKFPKILVNSSNLNRIKTIAPIVEEYKKDKFEPNQKLLISGENEVDILKFIVNNLSPEKIKNT